MVPFCHPQFWAGPEPSFTPPALGDEVDGDVLVKFFKPQTAYCPSHSPGLSPSNWFLISLASRPASAPHPIAVRVFLLLFLPRCFVSRGPQGPGDPPPFPTPAGILVSRLPPPDVCLRIQPFLRPGWFTVYDARLEAPFFLVVFSANFWSRGRVFHRSPKPLRYDSLVSLSPPPTSLSFGPFV